jgi:hypothetical protein
MRIKSSAVLGDLREAALRFKKLRALRDELAQSEQQRIVKSLPAPQSSHVRTLQGAVAFLEKLATTELPEAVRREVLQGRARGIMDGLKVHAAALTEALNETANHKKAVIELGRLNPYVWIGQNDLDGSPIEKLETGVDYALGHWQALPAYLEFLCDSWRSTVSMRQA